MIVPSWLAFPNLAEVRAVVQACGPVAPVAMVAAMVLQQLFPLFPGGLLTALAGTIFGIPEGLGVAIVGTSCAAAACHAVGSGPGRMLVERLVGQARLRALEARLEGHGLRTVMLIRAFPFFPSFAVSYAAGIVGLSRGIYVLGSLVGTLPSNVLHVVLGDRLSSPRDPALWLALGGLCLLAAGATWVERRCRR